MSPTPTPLASNSKYLPPSDPRYFYLDRVPFLFYLVFLLPLIPAGIYLKSYLWAETLPWSALFLAGGISVLLIIPIVWLLHRVTKLQRERRKFALQVSQEKMLHEREKEEQQRYYANLIHEVIKGEAQCILADVVEDEHLREKLSEFVKTCELGQTFVDKENNNLYDLMKGMEFVFSNRLHSEMREQYFYCDLDESLRNVNICYRQKYELIFFLRECLNNIKKHAQYRHVGLNMRCEPQQRGGHPNILLLIRDDGVGLQAKFNIAEPELEINAQNLSVFQGNMLRKHHCTGIAELFKKTARMQGKLTIKSTSGFGTQVQLLFSPNPG